MFAVAVALATGMTAFAENGKWEYRAGVGTCVTNWALWTDTANWTGGVVAAGSAYSADLSTATDRYIKLPDETVTLKGIVGSDSASADKACPVLYGNSLLSFASPAANVGCGCHIYTPWQWLSSGYVYSGPRLLSICADCTALHGQADWQCVSHIRFDRYANSSDAVRRNACFPKGQGAVFANWGAGMVFVAPCGCATNQTYRWSQTTGSAFLMPVAVGDRPLPVGTIVTGSGIPSDTFLKRIFPDGSIELSHAATTTASDNALTFAAFTADVSVRMGAIQGLGASASSPRHFVAQKYRNEDALRVEVGSFSKASGTVDDTGTFRLYTEDGFVPGVIAFYASNAYESNLRLENVNVEFCASQTGVCLSVPNNASHVAHVSVTGDLSVAVGKLSNVKGTFVKEGTGTLTVNALEGNLKAMTVAAGTLRFGAATDAHVTTLTVKAGATFEVPSEGMTCDTLVAEEGAAITGSGSLKVGNLSTELVGKLSLGAGVQLVDSVPETGHLSFEIVSGTVRRSGYQGDQAMVFSGEATVRVRGTGSVRMLLVGGGGGGGSKQGGGGGGGGVIDTNNVTLTSGYYRLAVGAGGAGAPDEETLNESGGDSTGFGFLAYGGGAGGTYGGGERNGVSSNRGVAGGSGGGGGIYYPNTSTGACSAGAGVTGQGHDGGHGQNVAYPVYTTRSARYCCGGGGGGAGAPGEVPTILLNASKVPTNVEGACGGDGIFSDILGAQYYGGGGGGGCTDMALSTACLGGKGGGGNGARKYSDLATDAAASGTDGLGGGGGGGCGYDRGGGGGPGGDGGDGTIILRWHDATEPEPAQNLLATGGDRIRRHGGYAIHSFTNDGSFVLSTDALVDILLVGGGGGGGAAGGGGGAGGVVVVSNAWLKAGTYPITIGQGGAGGTDLNAACCATSGSATILKREASEVCFIAAGGGAGGTRTGEGESGASSGGGGAIYVASTSLSMAPGACLYPEQGHVGGYGIHQYTGNVNDDYGTSQGGGGGGAGASGGDATSSPSWAPGNGGDGVYNDFSGKSVCYGGGGGGGSACGTSPYTDVYYARGGAGGGGRGGRLINWSSKNISVGEKGTDGLGGGGGGGGSASAYWAAGGDGGSGIVIIRYRVKKRGMMFVVR